MKTNLDMKNLEGKPIDIRSIVGVPVNINSLFFLE